MSREIERRIISTSVELRKKDGTPGMLQGYGALYESMSEDLGGFREVIRAGAFDRALREGQDILIRAEHDSKLLLGRTSSGTARVTADDKGLRYEVDVPDTQAGRDTMELVRRRDISQSSFAFSIPTPETGERWSVQADGSILRELLDVDLHDCAPVSTPAYSQTSVSARALDQAKATKPEPPDARALALKHYQEKREAAFEDKVSAVWNALYDLLGYSYEGPGWCIEATYSDSVVVETSPGKYFRYPLSFDAQNTVTLGEPEAVEPQWVPVASMEGRTAADYQAEIEAARERMKSLM